MDFNVLLTVGFLWFVFNLLRGNTKTGTGTPRPPARPRGPAEPPAGRPPQTRDDRGRQTSSRPLPAPSGTDPTQREGSRLESLLGDLNRSLEAAARAKGTAPRDARRTAESAATSSRPTTDADEARSIESDAPRPSRVVIDQDDAAEQLVARRVAAAEARNAPPTAAEHQAFDRRIRQEPADHTAVRTYSSKQLGDAIVWREILGPPVALRDPLAAERRADAS